MTENFNEDMNKNIIEALKQQANDEEDFDFDAKDELIDEVEQESEFSSADDVVHSDVSEPSMAEEDFSVLDEIAEEDSAVEPTEDIMYKETVYDTPQEEPIYNESQSVEESHYEAPMYESHVEDIPSYEQESAPHAVVEKLADELYQFEIPSNVAVLKKLISQLPSGVTRQTGAQIIKQTMEALGISMKSVLQDAQAVQEKLNNSAKECQATIQEYKRQIATLEEQASSYRKQYNNLNDLVSLFIQH